VIQVYENALVISNILFSYLVIAFIDIYPSSGGGKSPPFDSRGGISAFGDKTWAFQTLKPHAS
jgi:hypothetical protein